MQVMFEIQAATLAARARTGDKNIGTKVKAGKLQLVRTTYSKKGIGIDTPLTEYLPIPDAIKALNALQ